ncbi:S8 family serine peptidase [Tenacibaculum agarivorans]|uniref:S8 family serine peptidase n=1 Tax=Tenacibaculum agarivorans TaxID=1908389 RepID=UPI00094BB732|nr:S8 family serine peptidase [Tenacibaculum agarivorans]
MKKILLIIIFTISSCKSFKKLDYKDNARLDNLNIKKIKSFKNWHLKDFETDTILGISLDRAYDTFLIHKKAKPVIVAIIDTEIDTNHKGLKNKIWLNKDEIPNNNIDDDRNGYTDDINGWNFKGNKNGESSKFVNFEYVRVLKKLNVKYRNLDSTSIKKDKNYPLFLRATKAYKKREEYEIKEKENAQRLSDIYFNTKKKIKGLLNGSNKLTIEVIDSFKKLKKIDEFNAAVLTHCIKNNTDSLAIEKRKFLSRERIDKLMNLNYNDRIFPNDNESNILDSLYGNKYVNNNLHLMTHGTKMAGVIKNISKKDEISIMPIVISSYGDEHDKDIALAIRYAVNNGAKVINMSFGKEFSMNQKWVIEAIKYAEKKDVIILSSAGNSGFDLDKKNNYQYPSDNFDSEKEETNNFITIGSSSYSFDKKLKVKSSNYGKSNVDLFAPGRKISTIAPNEKESYTGGTSGACAVVSGVAGLIRSYYPKLTASQVKYILMESGLEFDIEVNTPTKEDKDKTTPFNQLSKSGKILNAYNVLLMADSISR